jgi:hypothetical protein
MLAIIYKFYVIYNIPFIIVQQHIPTSVLGYQKIDSKWCGNSIKIYGSYNSLNDAMAACTADTNCGIVYDPACDNQGVFNLCYKDAPIEKSSSGSCIYERAGMFLSLILIHQPYSGRGEIVLVI